MSTEADAKYMLDTNICIYILKRKPLSVLERFAQIPPEEVVVSTVTWGEMCYGAMKSQNPKQTRKTLDAFFAQVKVCPMHPDCGDRYGKIKSDLEKRGVPIGPNDLWIAAHALSLNLTLVTNNTKEFERIPKLKVENWV